METEYGDQVKRSKKLRKHLNYEFSMLEWASSQIDQADDFRPQAVQNAILECFLIHANVLYEELDWSVQQESIFYEDVTKHAYGWLHTLSRERARSDPPPTFRNHAYIVKELRKLHKRE